MNGYETAWGAVVFDILIALPDKFAANAIAEVFSKFGFDRKFKKYFKEISRDLVAYLTLSALDFKDTSDSIDWEIASNPAEDFILFEAPLIKSGIKKKSSGLISWPSTEYLTLFI